MRKLIITVLVVLLSLTTMVKASEINRSHKWPDEIMKEIMSSSSVSENEIDKPLHVRNKGEKQKQVVDSVITSNADGTPMSLMKFKYDENGNQIQQFSFSWVQDDGLWTPVSKTVNEYDELNRMLEAKTYSYSDLSNQWVPVSKVDFVYTEVTGESRDEITSVWNIVDESWTYSSKTCIRYIYLDHKSVVQSYAIYEWSPIQNEWECRCSDFYEFDNLGFKVSEVLINYDYDASTGGLATGQKQESRYDVKGNIVSHDVFGLSEDKSTWVIYLRQIFEWNEMDELVLAKYSDEWNDATQDFKYSELHKYTYDEEGLLKTYDYFFIVDGTINKEHKYYYVNVWDTNTKEDIIYTKLLYTYEYQTDVDVQHYDALKLTGYIDDIVISVMYYRNAFKDGMDNNVLEETYGYYYDSAGRQTWDSYSNLKKGFGYWYEWEYNDNGNELMYAHYHYDQDGVRDSGKYEYTYDENQFVTLSKYYTFSMELDDWQLLTNTEIFYSQLINNLIDANVCDNDEIKIDGHVIYFSEPQIVRIFTSDGKLVYNCHTQRAVLTPGLYIIHTSNRVKKICVF